VAECAQQHGSVFDPSLGFASFIEKRAAGRLADDNRLELVDDGIGGRARHRAFDKILDPLFMAFLALSFAGGELLGIHPGQETLHFGRVRLGPGLSASAAVEEEDSSCGRARQRKPAYRFGKAAVLVHAQDNG
jgi:hypothetical protein